MRRLSIGHLGLSLIGFFALVQALVLFPSFATSGVGLLRSDQNPVLVVLITIMPFALLILLGVGLVTNPDRIAPVPSSGAHARRTVVWDFPVAIRTEKKKVLVWVPSVGLCPPAPSQTVRSIPEGGVESKNLGLIRTPLKLVMRRTSGGSNLSAVRFA